MYKTHIKAPVSESLFRKVTGLHPSALFRKGLWNRYFPVHFVKFVREPFYRTIRSSRQEVFCNKSVLGNFPKFIGKHLYQKLNKVAGLRPEACNYIKKETLAQVFSCEFCGISKITFFTEHLWATASELSEQYAFFAPFFKQNIVKMYQQNVRNTQGCFT